MGILLELIAKLNITKVTNFILKTQGLIGNLFEIIFELLLNGCFGARKVR